MARGKNVKYKGRFRPQNPEKYRGNPTQIFYRSGWELKYMCYLDNNPAVKSWRSEEIIVPYISPKDRRTHRYFPDFVVEFIDKEDKPRTMMIEVKPSTQTRPPKRPEGKVSPRKARRFLSESITYAVNMAKWQFADAYCKKRGWKFEIFTEKELGIKV